VSGSRRWSPRRWSSRAGKLSRRSGIRYPGSCKVAVHAMAACQPLSPPRTFSSRPVASGCSFALGREHPRLSGDVYRPRHTPSRRAEMRSRTPANYKGTNDERTRMASRDRCDLFHRLGTFSVLFPPRCTIERQSFPKLSKKFLRTFIEVSTSI